MECLKEKKMFVFPFQDFHKREKLRNGLPNGKEICSAIDWIESNRDQLVGEVYMPIALLVLHNREFLCSI
jgi:hypothetical protein